MSSGAGHIMDMMNRIRQNAALKVSRRNKFKGGNTYTTISNLKTEYDFPEVSNSKLELIKFKIREEALKDRKKQYLYWVLSILLIALAFLIFNFA